MDADALIKLAKSGNKELVASHIEIWIPPDVFKEVVIQGKMGGYPDAHLIEANVTEERIRLIEEMVSDSPEAILLTGGERQLLAAYRTGAYAAVITDDRRVVAHLRALGIRVLTAGGALVYLKECNLLSKQETRQALNSLMPLINPDEYAAYLLSLGE